MQRLLDAHDPYPGVVIDRRWDVVLANQAAFGLLDLPEHLLVPVPNVFRVSLHADGLAARTTNLHEWAGHLLQQLRRTIELTGDAGLLELEAEVRGYPNVAALLEGGMSAAPPDDATILLPVRLLAGGGDGEVELSLFTTLTTFGTPRDITVEELAVELFFPADEQTEAHLRGGSRP